MLTTSVVLFAVVVLFIAGIVTGVAGFGFALIGTMALATTLPPAVAVVVMLVPILATNVSLLRELDTDSLVTCGRRFGSFVLAALIGTIVGMVLLERMPDAPLSIGLGIVTLAYVASAQQIVPISTLERAQDRCFVETTAAKIILGGVSGLLFGGTNVGVQMVAYLRSCGLSHALFIGVIAMIFVGINVVRVGTAAWIGLYPSLEVVAFSAGLAIIGLGGVSVGRHVRPRIDAQHQRWAVLGLLSVIGVRLILAGFGL